MPFALPKKYSHRKLHEYKLNFEFILRIFSNRADATRILYPRASLLLFFSFIASFCHPRPFLSPSSFHHRNPLFMKENWRPFLNLSRSNMTTGAGPRGTRTYLELFLPWQENTPVANAVKPAVIIHRPYTAWDMWGSFLVTSQCGRPGSEHNSSRSLTGSPVRSFVSGSELLHCAGGLEGFDSIKPQSV